MQGRRRAGPRPRAGPAQERPLMPTRARRSGPGPPAGLQGLRDAVVAEVGKVVVGQAGVADAVVAALAVGGHVLLEGVPGVAKTLLANAAARAIGCEFRR